MDTETVPTTWTELDEQFFRLVADVFATDFLWGASTLLGSHDVEPVTSSSPAPALRSSSVAGSAAAPLGA